MLDRVYDYDAKLLDQVEQFAQADRKAAGRKTQRPPPVADLLARPEAMEQAWDGREDMLKGVD